MADHQTIFKARQNGAIARTFGPPVNVDRVVDMLVSGSQPSRHAAVRRNANRMLQEMAAGPWELRAGPHVGGFGGSGLPADTTRHITIRTNRGGYHLKMDARGHLFEITGHGMDAVPPEMSPGAAPSVKTLRARLRMQRRQRGFVELDVFKHAGKAGLKAALTIGQIVLSAYIIDRIWQQAVQDQLQSRAGEIEAQLAEDREIGLALQSQGKQAWANVKFTVRTLVTFQRTLTGGWQREFSPPHFAPFVDPKNIVSVISLGAHISDSEVTESGPESVEIIRDLGGAGSAYRIKSFTYSFKVDYSSEAVGLFSEYKNELAYYDYAISDPDVDTLELFRLLWERQMLRDEFRAFFGPKPYQPPPRPVTPAMAPPPVKKPAPKPAAPKPQTMGPDAPVA